MYVELILMKLKCFSPRKQRLIRFSKILYMRYIVEREKTMSLGYQEKCEEKRKKIPKTGGKMSMNESNYGYATFHA